MNKPNFFLSRHAKQRLAERSSLVELDLSVVMTRSLPVTIEKFSHRLSYLYFSAKDERFIIFVADISNGEILTVITVDYWENLRSENAGLRQILNTRGVSRDDLLGAVQLTDPEHEILQSPPLRRGDRLYLFFIRYQIGMVKEVRFGPIPVEIFIDGSGRAITFVQSSLEAFIDEYQVLPTFVQASEFSSRKRQDEWRRHELDQNTEISEVAKLLQEELQEKRDVSRRYPIFSRI